MDAQKYTLKVRTKNIRLAHIVKTDFLANYIANQR